MENNRTKRDLENRRYELIITNVIGPFDSVSEAAAHAARFFPDFKEDPDRAPKTWDVQIIGT